MRGFVQEPCSQEHRFTSPQVGEGHLDFIRKKLLKQEEAEEALEEMALAGLMQLMINSSIATGV